VSDATVDAFKRELEEHFDIDTVTVSHKKRQKQQQSLRRS